MLSTTMVKALNAQLNRELYSSNLYLQMSAWCTVQGLPGCAGFLGKQGAEEMDHMRRLFTYVNETGALAVLGAVQAPPTDFGAVDKIFRQAFAHEQAITRHINALVEGALKGKDFATFNFLQWYVAEQHEEESLFRSILDKLSMVGPDKRGLFFFDREIGALAAAKSA